MNIVLIINNMEGGGAEHVVSNLSNYFTDQFGHKITIITIHKPNVVYELPRSVRVLQLKTGVLCQGVGKILFLPLLAFELSCILKKIKPDSVMSFLVRSNFVHILSKFFGNKSKVFISERATTDNVYFSRNLSSFVMKTLVKMLYRRAESIVAISEGVKNSLTSLGISSDRIHVIYNPVALDRIKKLAGDPPEVLRPANKYHLLNIGRLTEQKDQKALIAAIPLIKKRFDVHLTILGDGHLRHSLKQQAIELGIEDDVAFPGWIANPFAVIKDSDIFILSSIFEGFGNVVVEAMACGIPIISTDCPSGPAEILSDGKYGVLTEPGNSEHIANAVIKLFYDRDHYENLKLIGQVRANDFDISKISKQYIKVLES